MTELGMRHNSQHGERGTTLIETLIATAICVIVVVSLAGLVGMSTRQAKDMGSTVAQASTLASQKLEQLMGMEFSDPDTQCGTVPCINAQLCPSTAGTYPTCGSLTADVTNFVDYLKFDGSPAASATGADVFFIRRWSVAYDNTYPTSIRVIRVRVRGRTLNRDFGPAAPTSDVTSLKGQL